MSSLLKLPSFSDAERRAARNLASLSPKELAVAQGILDGGTNKEIGRLLGNSPRTIECHRSRILNKLGIHGANDLLRVAIAAAQRPNGPLGEGKMPELPTETVSDDLDAIFAPSPERGGKGKLAPRETVEQITFRPEGMPDSMNVYLILDSNKKSAGFLLAPDPVVFELGERHYPPLNILRPSASAIAYGLFLSLLLDLPLNVTGERAVWDGGQDFSGGPHLH